MHPAVVRATDPTTFGTARAAIGAGSWLAPKATGKAFGLGDIGADPRAALLARLFGARDLALGVAIARGPLATRRAAVTIGVAVDSADTVAALLAARKGLHPAAALLADGAAATFAALGALILRDLD